MTLTKKVQSLLKDLQNEEKMCAEKYQKAAQAANDPLLQEMFTQIGKDEQSHYDTVTQMLSGVIPEPKAVQEKKPMSREQLRSQANRAGKQQDAYLLDDLLATEKYISANYNTSIFEFSDEKARQVMNGIQAQEQHHGKQLSDYMQANGMYC